MPQIVARTVDQMVMTWLLTLVCSAHCFNNPYLVAKLVEVLFMMNPSVQVYKFFISSRFLSSFSFYNSFSLVRKRYMSGY
jgi:ubiquitin conjugation factor E4 B